LNRHVGAHSETSAVHPTWVHYVDVSVLAVSILGHLISKGLSRGQRARSTLFDGVMQKNSVEVSEALYQRRGCIAACIEMNEVVVVLPSLHSKLGHRKIGKTSESSLSTVCGVNIKLNTSIDRKRPNVPSQRARDREIHDEVSLNRHVGAHSEAFTIHPTWLHYVDVCVRCDHHLDPHFPRPRTRKTCCVHSFERLMQENSVEVAEALNRRQGCLVACIDIHEVVVVLSVFHSKLGHGTIGKTSERSLSTVCGANIKLNASSGRKKTNVPSEVRERQRQRERERGPRRRSSWSPRLGPSPWPPSSIPHWVVM